MSNSGHRLTGLAGEIVAVLEPGCERVVLAGALRRGETATKDVDIVCQPKYEATVDLFGKETGRSYARFYGSLDMMTARFGLSRSKAGPKLQIFYDPETGASVDLFIVVPPAQWGAILAIRTGPREFSHLCVKPRLDGGAMPMNMRQQGGALWRGGQLVETPEEADWFAALGLPCWEPRERSVERLRAYLRGKAGTR